MKESDLLNSLLAHTGNLKPAPGASNAELNDLRRAFTVSLQGGQAVSEIGSPASTQPVSEITREDLGYFAAQESSQTERTRIARRDPGMAGTRRWAMGMQPSQTLGPFVDEFGRPHWFDIFRPRKSFRVVRGNNLLLLLPIGTQKHRNEPTLELPAGTVWIRASQLTSAVPADTWVGIRIKKGTIKFSQSGQVANSILTVQASTLLTLEIELDPPVVAGPNAGSGSEATHAEAKFPKTATIVFAQSGVQRIKVDNASLNVYGNEIELTHVNNRVSYEPTFRMVLIPLRAAVETFKTSGVRSTVFKPKGSSPIEKAFWGLTVTVSQPDNLGLAAGVGSLGLALTGGMVGSWLGISDDEVRFGKVLLAVDHTSLTVTAQRAEYFRGQQTLKLWQESTNSRSSTIDIQFPRPFPLWFVSNREGFDGVAVQTRIAARVDRPILVDGSRLQIELNGSAVLLQKGDGITVSVEAITQPSAGFRPVAVALSNALLTITTPTQLFLNGKLGLEMQVPNGTLVLGAGVYQVLPILPDPYAANFEPRQTRDAPLGGVLFRATIIWPDVMSPSLDVVIDTPANSVVQLLPSPNENSIDPFVIRRAGGNLYWLLDVSSGGDQLGLSLSIPNNPAVQPEAQLQISNLSLQFPGNQLYAMLLPQFQWEAVYNTRNPRSKDVEGWLQPASSGGPPTDGGPSFLKAETAELIPMAPVPVAAGLIRAYAGRNAPSAAAFTLPFGITARALMQDERYTTQPRLRLLTTRFDGLTAARQISLVAGEETFREVEGNQVFLRRGSLLSGRTVQTENFAGTRNNTLGILRTSFNNTFTSRVPIERIDLSGYGASIFSRWISPQQPDIGITQVSFDAFNGRTSFERIQMVSLLWPCLSRVVRTIVLERQGSGSVVRWDSGWLSTKPGLFFHKEFQVIHKCVVDGMYDIREIRDTDQILELPSTDPLVHTAEVQAVYYDADIAFTLVDGRSPIEAGQNSSGRVPARRQLGFVQLVPLPEPPPDPPDFAAFPAKLLSREQFDLLIQKVGPLGGPIDCKLKIGKSRQSQHITSMVTDRGGSIPPNTARNAEFAVTLTGSPIFSSSAKWSVVSVDNGDQTVYPIDPRVGVPLIQRNGGSYRWADPQDLLQETQAKRDYALLMAHDTQRFLMQRPKIEVNSANISSTVQAKVADPYSMLSSTGLFPRVDQVIKLSAGAELIAGTLQLAGSKLNVGAGLLGLAQKQLVDQPMWKEVADFSQAALSIDSLDEWKIRLKRIKQRLEFKGFGEIMTVNHDFESASDELSKFLQPKLEFGPELQEVKNVLDILNSLSPALPDGIGPFKLAASFSGTSFTLSAVADFKLATKDDDAIECGVGKIKGSLKIGAELSADIIKKDIRGAVFLEITGSYQQQIFPFLYAGGQLRFLIRGDQTGKPTLELDACTMGSIGGTVIPGLIDLEATVKYGYFIQVKTKLTPGIVVGMEGRAKLLSGLVGFKFGVEGRAIIDPQPLVNPEDDQRAIHLYGRIRVSGTVTLAWAIEKSKSFETDFNVAVDWKLALAAAKAGLLPVP